MTEQTSPEAAAAPGRQMFSLVDAAKAAAGGKKCGCGGHGGGHGGGRGHGGGGCGCGGKGHAHAAPAAPAPAPAGGCGCGGHGHSHAARAESVPAPAQGGCGCGGHGHSHAAPAPARAQAPAAGELVVHSIPRVVRHAVLFHAMDALPVGETLVIVAPHQPEPLFDHLRDSEAHYRVETLQAGPADWRYAITRLS